MAARLPQSSPAADDAPPAALPGNTAPYNASHPHATLTWAQESPPPASSPPPPSAYRSRQLAQHPQAVPSFRAASPLPGPSAAPAPPHLAPPAYSPARA